MVSACILGRFCMVSAALQYSFENGFDITNTVISELSNHDRCYNVCASQSSRTKIYTLGLVQNA